MPPKRIPTPATSSSGEAAPRAAAALCGISVMPRDASWRDLPPRPSVFDCLAFSVLHHARLMIGGGGRLIEGQETVTRAASARQRYLRRIFRFILPPDSGRRYS